MKNRTYINKLGLPVLARLIEEGRITFDESLSHTTAPDIANCIEEADRMLLEQRLEDSRSLFPNRHPREIISTEEYMEVTCSRHRKKCQRIAAARLLLFALMDLPCSNCQEKHVGGLLAETFMLESDWESAFFWLAVSYPSPHYRAPLNLNETRGRVHGFGRYLPRICQTPENAPVCR